VSVGDFASIMRAIISQMGWDIARWGRRNGLMRMV